MIIKNIYLGDFGVFQNENLSDINSGIVVIGGGNRAGKTTFMQILRHLSYGFPRDGSLPSPADEYHVEADLQQEAESDSREFNSNQNSYHLSIRGYASPKLSSSSLSRGDNNSLDITAADLYNNLDKFTYRQLFTISLNELKKSPGEISGRKEEDRLYSVLMGAGLAQIMELPQIARYYFRRAKDIGGKLGDPAVAGFAPYQEKIAAAENKKEEGLKRVAEYLETEKKIAEIKEEIGDIEKNIGSRGEERIRLDVLKNNYDNFSRLLKLQNKLKQHQGFDLSSDKFTPERKLQAENLLQKFNKVKNNYQDKLSEFQAGVSRERVDEICSKFLSCSSGLENFGERLSGLRNKTENFLELREKQQKDYRQLQLEAGEINEKWEQHLSRLDSVRTDEISRGELLEKIDEAKKLNNKLKDKQEKKQEVKRQIKDLNQQKEELKDVTFRRSYRLSILGVGLSFIAGAAVSWLDLMIGALAGGAGLILTFMFFITRFQQAKNIKKRKHSLQKEFKSRQQELSSLNQELDGLEEQIASIEKTMNNYRRQLGLGKDTNLDLIKDYFNSLRNIKRRYREWQLQQQTLRKKRENLEKELNELRELILKLNKEFTASVFAVPEPENLIAKSQQLFSSLERAQEYLRLAREFATAREKMNRVEKEIGEFFSGGVNETFEQGENLQQQLQNYIKRVNLCQEYNELERDLLNIQRRIIEAMNSADRIREAFLNAGSNDDYHENNENCDLILDDLKGEEKKLLNIFSRFYNEYTSAEEVNDAYQEVSAVLEKLKDRLNNKKERLQNLKDKKNNLASPDKIEEAHASLDEARTQLRQLAEKYAINRSISFILHKVRERFITRAEDELLEPASDMLRKMTGGEIEEIFPAEDLEEKDFAAVLSQGEKHESVETLSRGTREQLFLAVRLSRIKEIDPPLPVILDDSLVNFDRNHLSSAAQILSQLGQSHQIFLLTCHPHLVKYIHNSTGSAQYWHLEQGEFTRTDAEKLRNTLSNES